MKKAPFLLVLALISAACEQKPASPQPSETVWQSSTPSSSDMQSSPEVSVVSEEIELEEDLTRRNIVLVFDASGSMEGRKLKTAKAAVKTYVSQVPEGTNLGLVVFDTKGVRAPVSVSLDPRKEFSKVIEDIRAGGVTPLKSAIELGYGMLIDQSKKQLQYGEYHLVVVTDGEANSGEDPQQTVTNILANSPVVIHTIGFQIGGRHSLNQPGKVRYIEADDEETLLQGLQTVLAEAEQFDVKSFGS